jgi:hypothetical protein
MIKANIDGNEVELKPDQLQLGEGYALVTPDSIPDGLYKEEAVQAKVQERVKNLKQEIKDKENSLLNDDEFSKRVLSKYNIALDADGNPKGLDTVDKKAIQDEIRTNIAQEYDSKIEQKDQTIQQLLNKSLEADIVDGANQIGVDADYLKPRIEGSKPYVVKEFSDHFKYNEDINAFAQVKDGDFVIDSEGLVTVNRFFNKNKESLSGILADQRQGGSDFGGGGNPGASSPSDILSWKSKQKSEYIAKHGADKYRKAIEQAVQAKK